MSKRDDSLDPRVFKTREAILEALLSLCESSGFSKITVGDIVKHARINRATFYKHYRDKYDLVERIFEGTLTQILELSSFVKATAESGLTFQDAFAEPPYPLIQIFEYFLTNRRLYRAILTSDQGIFFHRRLCVYFTELLNDNWTEWQEFQQRDMQPNEQPMPGNIAKEMSAFLLFDTITWWLESDMTYSAGQMATWYRRFMATGTIGHLPSKLEGSNNSSPNMSLGGYSRPNRTFKK